LLEKQAEEEKISMQKFIKTVDIRTSMPVQLDEEESKE
jgi:hypothetical protein